MYSSLSKAPLSSFVFLLSSTLIILTWWGSWRGWRCRRGCHGYVPSGCSLCCPSSRPSCQGKTKDGKKENVRGFEHRQESNSISCHQFVINAADRRHHINATPTNSLSFHLGGLMSHLLPFRQVMWCPTCSWRSSTSSPWCSLRSPLPAQRDWCLLCCSCGRSKYLGTWQRGRVREEERAKNSPWWCVQGTLFRYTCCKSNFPT